MAVMDGTDGASDLPAGEWSVDASRSSVGFAVRHMLVASVNGRFREFDGMLTIGPDGIGARGVVKAASFDTSDPVRDEHVRRSPDFFDVERYPEIGFSSSRVQQRAGSRFRIVGELTIRDATREIELDAQLDDVSSDAGSGERIELTLRGELDRRDFGLVWNQALETGGALLGNVVKLALEITAVKSDGAGWRSLVASPGGTP